jgi:hypothetical protein
MFIKKVPPNGSRLLLNSLFLRKISTNLTVSPEVVDAIYGGSEIVSFKLVPNYEQIDQQKRKLQQLYQENRDFKKFADNLFKAYKNPSVKSIAISFDQEKKLDEIKVNPFFQPTLVATSLIAGIGLVPFYNQENFLSHALVDKESIRPITGHQDSMFLDPNDNYPSLIPTLLLVNGYSQSNAKTWFKEGSDIICEFKEKYPSSFKVLKQINFIGFPLNRIDEIENYTPQKIIGGHDNINFVSGFRYIPISKDLEGFKILKSEAELAILRFREVVNSKQNRHEFVLNNDEVQFLIFKNEMGVHGRDQVEENQKGRRLIIAIPLTSIRAQNSIPIDKNGEKSK